MFPFTNTFSYKGHPTFLVLVRREAVPVVSWSQCMDDRLTKI